ncbi:MAG: NTP transferase domain-containing protein [Bacteroidota bacterium]
MATPPQAARTAVVLAAGFGSRLEGVSDETALKPLTPVAGVPLLKRTLGSLDRAGCDRIVLVVGHGADDVEQAARALYDGPAELRFAVNPRYDLANGVSVLAAQPHVDSPFLLTMADHVFGDEVMELARDHIPPADGATLLVDRDVAGVFDLDDATKVRTDGTRLVAVGKQLDTYDCIDTGLFVCTPALFDALQAVYDGRGDASLSDGVQHFAATDRMRVLDIGDGFWQDVDTPEMLAEAERRLAEQA